MSVRLFVYLATIQFSLFIVIYGSFDVEPKCSKFDYEEKLLEKMVRMEHGTGLMKDEFHDISLQVKGELEIMRETAVQIKEEQNRLMDLIEELRWEEWGPWGSCAASCSDGVGERLQSRTRGKKAPDDATSQTESRPCSSVQFAGCQHPNNTDQFYAVMYDYSYVLAQASCTAMASGGYTRAVKRTCSSSAADCSGVCKTVGQTCFNSLHVYSGGNAPPLQRDTVEQKSLMMYKYNACGGGCGPNFCCCKS